MHITNYKQTVTITLELSYDEHRVLETVRKAPVGPYWDSHKYTTQDETPVDVSPLVVTLKDVVFLRNAVAVCTGEHDSQTSIFTVDAGESPCDVPGGGELANTATSLYEDLNDLLHVWGHPQADDP